MGHNSVILGHPKSTGIPRVNGLLTGPRDRGVIVLVAGGMDLYARVFLVISTY